MLRVDEILAGATLALAFSRGMLPSSNRYLFAALAIAFAVSCHPASGPANYLRPYLAALLVGTTLGCPHERLEAILQSDTLRYIAEISFALYVFHPGLAATWLGDGDKLVKYLKRPLLIAACFALAHVSTFYFERRFIDFGRRLSASFAPVAQA